MSEKEIKNENGGKIPELQRGQITALSLVEYREQEYVLDADTAESEFIWVCHKKDVDIVQDGMTEDDLSSFNQAKRVIIRAIRQGILTVTDNGNYKYKPQDSPGVPEEITIKPPDNSMKIGMQKIKKSMQISQMFSMVGGMCGIHINLVTKFVERDAKVIEAVVEHFLTK